MEVHFTPDVEAKLEQMARELLDRRYDDLESAKVKPIRRRRSVRKVAQAQR